MTLDSNAGAASGMVRPGSDRFTRPALLLILLSLGVLFQGTRPLWEPDEGRYVAGAVQMIRSGDWMTPHLNHETPHLSKPPLTYWLVAASMSVLGQNELAARLPNAVAWMALIGIVFAISRRFLPGDPIRGALVWGTSLFPFVASNIVTTDFLLTAAEGLAVLGFVMLWKDDSKWGGSVMWTGFGIAFMIKGPPGLLPLIAIVVFTIVHRNLSIRRIFPLLGIELFALIVLPWFLHQIIVRPDLLDYFIGSEVVGRVGGDSFDRDAGWLGWVKPYVPVIVLGVFPWIAFVRQADRKAIWRTDEDRFLVLWILLPLSVFLLSSSRQPLYLLPLTIPAALLLARRLPSTMFEGMKAHILIGIWIVALLTLKVTGAMIPSPRDSRPLARLIAEIAGPEVREVHFVEDNAWYGLTFYLDVDVEQVSLDDSVVRAPAYRPTWEGLPEELLEDESIVSVYLVQPKRKAQFESAVRESDRVPHLEGSYDKFLIYSVSGRRNESAENWVPRLRGMTALVEMEMQNQRSLPRSCSVASSWNSRRSDSARTRGSPRPE